MRKITGIILPVILVFLIFTGCVVKVPSGSVKSDGSRAENQELITKEKAKEIALEKAGVTSDAATFERVELENDNGVWKYEIDFRKGKTEYELDIKADNGEIISFESDYE